MGEAGQQGTADPEVAASASSTAEPRAVAVPQEAGILVSSDLLPVGITTYTEVRVNSEARMEALLATAWNDEVILSMLLMHASQAMAASSANV